MPRLEGRGFFTQKIAKVEASCAADKCEFVKCKPGYGDCDKDLSNGCEKRLDTLTDCGKCGKKCEITGGTPSCVGGKCTASSCDPGFADCDGDSDNGCETSLTTLEDCGVCSESCGPLNCVFRAKSITDSGRSRSPIPGQADR